MAGTSQTPGGVRPAVREETFLVELEDICMIERESKSGEPDSQSTGHGNHAEHLASSAAGDIAAKEEKHNCLLVILIFK